MRIVLSLIIVCFMSVSCNTESPKAKEFDSNFAHVVYFWLKNPDNQEDCRAFEASLKKFLSTSEYAQTKFIGQPANTPREVVDNSWTYSIILTFPSKEVQAKYQQEPVHLKFIEESEHLWEKVQVYDSVGL
ncbi:MAG: Dabb family protein [Leeuwenhoekiella marinoflava]|uniref:Stress responsive alpha/beta barrel protein n=3 Tax=Leeuwenhoekiella marinoflava TaxID=988 RepID=A0A4Q0PMF0_9FLAO|nr:Dabb family protein [Leeuwenhoekiella marinoflava]RXG31650.1 stress responsive alpha/beta barrel protein [Leeuwenhoekiella marinoflava]SHF09786.1 Stress responsive A/B Barrel Domain [Leeuwenhoekiella marinoflava DSM 3653]